MPKKPEIKPRSKKINLITRIWKPNEKSGMANDAIPVIATTIIKIGLTILAETAACPSTKAPTIPIVGPIGEGTRKPASLISSNDISITIISKITGNGTFSLEAKIENRSSVGISSWWKFTIEIYIPGSKNVRAIAIILKTFRKFENWNFKFVSSGDDIKSINIAGNTRTYGFPFTITATLPSYKYFVTLSGRSVNKIWGTLYLFVSEINCSNWPRR